VRGAARKGGPYRNHIDAFLPGGLDGIEQELPVVFGKLVVLGSGRAHEERPHLGARGQ
jgi:hypothetical protein